MDYSTSILGTYGARKLQERTRSAVLAIGSDLYTRTALAQVDCFNYVAAQWLSAAIKSFRVKNTRELFDTVPPESLVLPRVGVVALAVLGAAFQTRGIGGEAPLVAWFQKHRNGNTITFDSLKAREAAEIAAERKDVKRRRHARRNQAHKIRSERFDARQETATS